MRHLLPTVALIMGLGLPGLQCAYADSPPPRASDTLVAERQPPTANLPRIELVDESDQRLPSFDATGRQYVLGQMGARYQVRVVNPTGARIEAVVTVDGLDAVDGRPGGLNKRGYIVPAYGDMVIDGFRTSLDTVAAFRFSSVRDSYAVRTRHARNVGVIGVAFFRERPPPVPRYSAPSVGRAAPAPSPAAQNAESNAQAGDAKGASEAPATSRPGLGTQFGEARQSRVFETTFVRADSSPSLVSEIRYDDREGLLARGIRLTPPPDPRDAENELRDRATPFPESRFAQPPY